MSTRRKNKVKVGSPIRKTNGFPENPVKNKVRIKRTRKHHESVSVNEDSHDSGINERESFMDLSLSNAVKTIANSVSMMEKVMHSMNQKIGRTDKTVQVIEKDVRLQGKRMHSLDARVNKLEMNLPCSDGTCAGGGGAPSKPGWICEGGICVKKPQSSSGYPQRSTSLGCPLNVSTAHAVPQGQMNYLTMPLTTNAPRMSNSGTSEASAPSASLRERLAPCEGGRPRKASCKLGRRYLHSGVARPKAMRRKASSRPSAEPAPPDDQEPPKCTRSRSRSFTETRRTRSPRSPPRADARSPPSERSPSEEESSPSRRAPSKLRPQRSRCKKSASRLLERSVSKLSKLNRGPKRKKQPKATRRQRKAKARARTLSPSASGRGGALAGAGSGAAGEDLACPLLDLLARASSVLGLRANPNRPPSPSRKRHAHAAGGGPLPRSHSLNQSASKGDAGGSEALSDVLGRNLLAAAHDGKVEAVRRLLRMGADANYATPTKWTALHRAASKAHSEIVGLLIQKGADVNKPTTYGYTPLHLAVSSDFSAESVMFLITAGADVDKWNRSGQTALHLAAGSGNMEAVLALLAAEASVSVRDECGRTPCDVARTEAIQKVLLQKKDLTPEEAERRIIKLCRLPKTR